jgi:glutamate 5-kinase
MSNDLSQSINKIWIVKIGSALLTKGGVEIDKTIIRLLASQIKYLTQQNIGVILVSSGAIASGMSAIDLKNRPTEIHKLQALASIGQMDLVRSYQEIFKELNLQTSQILLTNDNLVNKERYDNIYHTIKELINFGVVPIVNENDTVSTDEIKFGDNDNLAALLSNLIKADKLVILTDQNGLYDKNPAKFDDAKLITEISKTDERLEKFATDEGSSVGTGGMLSKVMAAKVAKCQTHIVGISENILSDIFNNKSTGTTLQN